MTCFLSLFCFPDFLPVWKELFDIYQSWQKRRVFQNYFWGSILSTPKNVRVFILDVVSQRPRLRVFQGYCMPCRKLSLLLTNKGVTWVCLHFSPNHGGISLAAAIIHLSRKSRDRGPCALEKRFSGRKINASITIAPPPTSIWWIRPENGRFYFEELVSIKMAITGGISPKP